MQGKLNIFQKALSLFGRTSPQFFTDSSLIGLGGTILAGNDSRLLEETYATSNDVYSVINKILVSMRMAEWELYTINKKGEKEYAKGTSLNELMAKPNSQQSWHELVETLAAYKLLTGNGYLQGTQAVGFGEAFKELNVLPSDKVEIIRGALEPIKGYIVKDERLSSFDASEVKHIKNFNPIGNSYDRLYGLSTIRTAYNAVITGKNQWEANASILKNRGIMGILTTKTGVRVDEATKKEMDAKFKERYGGAKNFGSPMLASGDLSFVPMGMSPADLKLIELGIIPLRALCNVYGVDSSLLNDPENKTYSNRKEAEKAMWDNAIIPILRDIEAALNTWLVPSYNKQDGKTYKIEFCLDDVKALQVDLTEMANRVKTLIEAGVYSQNEGREIMGYDKLDIPEMDLPKQSQPKQNNISQ